MNAVRVQSQLLASLSHGFFLRRGGYSKGVFAELNCGARTSDEASNVRRNLELVADRIGVGLPRMVTGRQIHSARVYRVSESPPTVSPEADSFVTAMHGTAVAVLSADCMPILFADLRTGSVAAAHAGWRGALAGVIENTVAEMVACGSRRSDIRAAIGPCISRDKYEVQSDFRDEFRDKDPASERFFAYENGNRLYFDLPGYGIALLQRAGIRDCEWIGRCTYSDPRNCFSYRRSRHKGETGTGLHISVIAVADRLTSPAVCD
ncbi:MAG: peptidoglycan editing factor PgeF [Rhodobacteraceae bacterium]|nr:peptidoglycan editing factor PgeF [Paracoccaceae bacterium]